MLHFHGIEKRRGNFGGFSKTVSLKKPLGEFLELHRKFGGDLPKIVKKIERLAGQIHAEAQGELTGKMKERIAVLARSKDFARFLETFPTCANFSLEIFGKLLENKPGGEKWMEIQSTLAENHGALFVVQPEVELSDSSSYVQRLLRIVELVFREEDAEAPPANLMLNFVPGKFPLYDLITTDTLDAALKFDWKPKNPLCRLEYLSHSLLREILDRGRGEAPARGKVYHLAPEDDHGTEKNPSVEVLITEDDEEGKENYQLAMIQMTPVESLMEFLRRVHKKIGWEGVLHFFGVIRQLCNSKADETFIFDVKGHLRLFGEEASEKRGGKAFLKHCEIAVRVLNEMEKLNIIRRTAYDSEKGVTEIRKKLFSVYRDKYETRKGESKKKKNRLAERHYFADRFFYPDENNPFHFGYAVKLIPVGFFRENYKQNQTMPFLAAYVYNLWLAEFEENRGRLSRTAEDIFKESGIEISKSSKYRSIYRLKNAFYWMADMNLIGDFSMESSSRKNPWKDLYEVVASEDIRQKISMIRQQALDKRNRSLAGKRPVLGT